MQLDLGKVDADFPAKVYLKDVESSGSGEELTGRVGFARLELRGWKFPVALCGGLESCRSGGIGRRAWFRSMYSQGCGGSSPPFGTKFLLQGVSCSGGARQDLRGLPRTAGLAVG